MASSVEHLIVSELTTAAEVLQRFMNDPTNVQAIATAADYMVQAIRAQGKIMACGNGGSYCDALHFVEELTGRYRQDRPALPAVLLGDAAHLTCVGNDYGFEYVFSRAVEALGQPGDVLVAISTSGNSANVLRAAESAQKKGIRVIGLTGKDGGQLAQMADIALIVPYQGYADRIQEVHIKVIHLWIALIERQLGYTSLQQ
ncbi:D-sedoheptulose 7-phosphate isomerase [Thermonema lapsum]|uniref:Phosphoheptose isomerase n=1 Tax=Thermonema lapsum TaxID=28195 RepID=A0A846MRZ0_9BACT|nr:D-sedoheptulose 7-phosphate isomerase [Thermonema lapsum]NIK74201.1 D-sedoheptulose 7-phosphate isomerase [Thermonema lapsum]